MRNKAFLVDPRETTTLTSCNFNVHSQGSQKTVSSRWKYKKKEAAISVNILEDKILGHFEMCNQNAIFLKHTLFDCVSIHHFDALTPWQPRGPLCVWQRGGACDGWLAWFGCPWSCCLRLVVSAVRAASCASMRARTALFAVVSSAGWFSLLLSCSCSCSQRQVCCNVPK